MSSPPNYLRNHPVVRASSVLVEVRPAEDLIEIKCQGQGAQKLLWHQEQWTPRNRMAGAFEFLPRGSPISRCRPNSQLICNSFGIPTEAVGEYVDHHIAQPIAAQALGKHA